MKNSHSDHHNTPLRDQIWADPALLEALSQCDDAPRQPHPKPHSRLLRTWLPMAASVLIVSIVALVMWPAPEQVSVQQAQLTQAGQQQLALDDGSTIAVNVARQLSYRIDAQQRHVALEEGEAFFSVSKNPAKPFVVDTPLSRVRVLGTKFNVNNTAFATDLEVYEGLVEFTNASGESVHVGAGKGARITAAGQISTFTLQQSAPLWQQGWLQIDKRHLNEAVVLLNRYADKRILLGPGIGNLEVSGRFSLSKMDDAVSLIAQAHHLRITQYPDSVLLAKQ